MNGREGFSPLNYLWFTLATLGTMFCACAWAAPSLVKEALGLSAAPFFACPRGDGAQHHRAAAPAPGALVALVGPPRAAPACRPAAQPLADGSTLGVSAGASLGAVLAIAFGLHLGFLRGLGTMGAAMLFAFGSLSLILVLAWRLDASLATNTIILIGVIFSMFVSALISLVIAFSGTRLRSVTFWTMGSLASSGWGDVLALLSALILCGAALLMSARELNAFAIGEDKARSVGVDVRRVKLRVLIAVSLLIGVCVSIGGSIGFVGLVTPHAARLIVGPNHRRLLPAVLFSGAIFLMLTDLIARTLLSPIELPLGVVTSLIGALLFVWLFMRSRRGR